MSETTKTETKKGEGMLVLSRKRGEGITINGNIEVKILDIRGGYVSVGINAPRDIDVFRNELLENGGPK